jgi:hypothetical protein
MFSNLHGPQSDDRTWFHMTHYMSYVVYTDLRVMIGRSFTPGGHCVVLERASVKQALEKRYFDPWKRSEEEAAKPAVPGMQKKGNLAAMSIAPTHAGI